jgi:hypothetical protein
LIYFWKPEQFLSWFPLHYFLQYYHTLTIYMVTTRAGYPSEHSTSVTPTSGCRKFIMTALTIFYSLGTR